MSDVHSLRRKIGSAEDLHSVVRTMKAMAASCIGQYESAVRSLDAYDRTVQLGLVASLRQNRALGIEPDARGQKVAATGAIVFGSDQGLVGQFNDVMAAFAVDALAQLPGEKAIWAVGERIGSRLAESGLIFGKSFALPNSINAITQFVAEILIEVETQRAKGEIGPVFLFHQRPKEGAIYAPVCQRLLPLDQVWQRDLASTPWPTGNLPEVMNDKEQTLLALVREYLFVSLFRACAESLASENASRLAAMQRAEKNINELLDDLKRTFHRLRQGNIDEELFDVISGFAALSEAPFGS